MGKTGRTQTPAQKAASERNLKKGWDAIAAKRTANPDPPPDEPAQPRVVRAKADPAKARRQPKPRKVPPRASAAPPPAEPKRRSGGGFFSGFMDGLGG